MSNITDIEDKIIARAKAEGRTEREVADQYEKVWWDVMDAPRRQAADREPARHRVHRATWSP